MKTPCKGWDRWTSSRLWLALPIVWFSLAVTVGAAERSTWRHPDARFAAIDDALADDDFTEAQLLLAELRSEAKRTRDAVLQAEVVEYGKDVTRQTRDYEKVRKHLVTLRKTPNDAKASLALGKYYCVLKGDWKQGVPLLAAGEDTKLAAVASAEFGDIVQSDDQFEVADRWWQYAAKVTDAGERIAYQLRSREWMIKARRTATDKMRATIDLRLQQVPLFIDKIVVWNTHNGGYNDSGAEALLVSLLYQDKVVWKETAEIPWLPNKPAYVILRTKHVRADQVRVDITKHHEARGGLGEIEVVAGRMNIAPGCEAIADAYFEFAERHNPSTLVDGDASGNTGFWVTNNGQSGWAAIHFSQFSK
jgi:hypothetical protein